MNNLACVSKILYDKEVIEKNKENYELKQKLKKYETPNLSLENEEEWEKLKEKEFSKLKKTIKNWCSNILIEYLEYEIDSIWMSNIVSCLEECLIKLTNNEEWAKFHKEYILTCVVNCLENLKYLNLTKNEELKENIGNMIYGSIVGILYERSPSVLDNLE